MKMQCLHLKKVAINITFTNILLHTLLLIFFPTHSLWSQYASMRTISAWFGVSPQCEGECMILPDQRQELHACLKRPHCSHSCSTACHYVSVQGSYSSNFCKNRGNCNDNTVFPKTDRRQKCNHLRKAIQLLLEQMQQA